MLVSTSIGEEGLDIGEIDRIVCYDAQQSSIRMVCVDHIISLHANNGLLVATHWPHRTKATRLCRCATG